MEAVGWLAVKGLYDEYSLLVHFMETHVPCQVVVSECAYQFCAFNFIFLYLPRLADCK